MIKHTNPFNAGSGLRPPYLAGRNEVLNEFSQMLQNIQAGKVENMLVHGLRDVGKTVLLHEFAQICIDKKFLPVMRLQYSQKYSDPIQFINTFKHDLNNATEALSKFTKTKGKIKSIANYLKPVNIEIPGIISCEPAYDSNSGMPLEDHLAEYLLKKLKIVKENNYKGIVFLLDEFHMVKNKEEKNWYILTDLIGAINEVQTKNCRCSLVLCGLPTLLDNVKQARSYSERMFQSLLIDNLDEASARKAILEPLKKIKHSFSNEVVSLIIKDTDRYPYFIQFFAKEIIEHTNKTDIQLRDYKKIRGAIMSKLGKDFFEYRMKVLSTSQNNVLYSMASMKEMKIEFSSILQVSNIAKGPLSNQLKRLEEKGFIFRPQRGIYQFTMPLFKEYLLTKSTK